VLIFWPVDSQRLRYCRITLGLSHEDIQDCSSYASPMIKSEVLPIEAQKDLCEDGAFYFIELKDRQMYEDRIVIDPAVRHGKPIIKGTRVPVEIILGSLAGGMEIDEITKEYDLDREDVLAALAYATRMIAGEEIGVYA
jgi:uncharacterized protein (DUF433 family)